ncbi:MAG: exo-alpha-sialidase [Anaerolineae bacterium]|nr:exo-alpha-sialidase [Anaerolineae bacterium]
MKHVIVFAREGVFAGWPANNGIWIWENDRAVEKANRSEILVGFTTGPYQVGSSHNIGRPYASRLARSLDGGASWQVETPVGFMEDGKALSAPTGRIDFSQPGFAMRVLGCAYHGSEEPRGGFYVSTDRGAIWQGPYAFAGLDALPQLQGAELTPRTDVLVNGPDTCLVFLSARSREKWGADRAFCVRTTDSGLSFQFVAWIVPPGDPYRAVMPSTVRCSADRLVSVLRRRDMDSEGACWIDAYASGDDGASWAFLSRIGESGAHNGNPPALARLKDGRLCCVYGQRDRRQMIARISRDEGATWGEAVVLRDDYASVQADQDLGYPRLVQRADGCLVAIYYWATRELPQQHIAATIWDPAMRSCPD